MCGFVVLEVFGHPAFIGAHQTEVFRTSMQIMLRDIRGRIPAADAKA